MPTPAADWYPDPHRPTQRNAPETSLPEPPGAGSEAAGLVRHSRGLAFTAAAVALVLVGVVLGQALQPPAWRGDQVEAAPVTAAASPTSSPTPTPTTPGPTPTPTPTRGAPEPAPAVDTDEVLAAAEGQSALAAVSALAVKGRAPRTGYDRDLFGSGWIDVDRNGCDTRNDMLARDLSDATFRPGTNDCVVLTGTLVDPYGGRSIAFVRGNATSNDVQIDHVVALSDAWQKGAQQWTDEARVAFANDPLNLLAVDGPLNAQKGDGDAATWLPPSKGFRCAYVARQVAVKVRYDAWVTPAERDAIVGVLSRCPDEPLPGGVLVAAPEPEPEPASVYYKNCSAARAAGAAPVRVGSPGYGTHLDRDGDGVGCE